MVTTDTAKTETVRAADWLDSARHWAEYCWRSGLDLLYPPVCLSCEWELPTPWKGPMLCQFCRDALYSDHDPQCRFCAAPVRDERLGLDFCVRCRGEKWRVDRIFALGRYRGPRQSIVLRMKSHTSEPLATAMGEIVAERFGIQLEQLDVEVVVPIPLHWKRRIEHGGNSAEAIAAPIASRLHLQQANDGLFRTRATEKQSRLSARQRAENVKGSIAVSTTYDWTDAKVLLVDDVLTYGCTANEAAKALRKAGAAKVYIAVVARGVGEF